MIPGTVSTPNGLMRADLNAGNRVCGCGQPATVIFYLTRRRGYGGARTNRTSRIPLCAKHDAANRAQRRAR